MKRFTDIPEYIIGHYCTILKGKYKNNTPTEVYEDILREWYFEEVKNKLDGRNIIILSFLLSAGVMGEDIGKLYDLINKKLFAFKTLEIVNSESEQDCDSCEGRGYDYCEYCDGGENECDECDGSGITDDEEDEGECSSCSGSGKIDCENCGGVGEMECRECGGEGRFTDKDHVDVQIISLVSFDKEIYDEIKNKKVDEEIRDNFLNYIENNDKVIVLNTDEEYGNYSTSIFENTDIGTLYVESVGRNFVVEKYPSFFRVDIRN